MEEKEENRSSSSKSTFCALAPELLPLILIQIFTESLAFMQDQGWVFVKSWDKFQSKIHHRDQQNFDQFS